MLTINNESGARLFTTAKIYVYGEYFTTLRSLGEVTKTELSNLLDVFDDGCFTNHLGESEPVLGNRTVILEDADVMIEIDVDWINGGLVSCHMMAEWEYGIRKAIKIAKSLAHLH